MLKMEITVLTVRISSEKTKDVFPFRKLYYFVFDATKLIKGISDPTKTFFLNVLCRKWI